MRELTLDSDGAVLLLRPEGVGLYNSFQACNSGPGRSMARKTSWARSGSWRRSSRRCATRHALGSDQRLA